MASPLRIIALTAALLVPLAARGEAPIGVDAAVNAQTLGTAPAGSPQVLAIGQPIVFDERIATEAKGQAQILFQDQSALTVGPSSDLVIDQFVYDPHAGTGKLAMNATRGVFRFVGGEISKLGDNAVTLNTPVATMGIRGGIFIARIAVDGSLTAVFLYGEQLTVTGRGGTTATIRRPGFAVSVDRGGSPSAPFPSPPGFLAALTAQFDGTGGAKIAAGVAEARLGANPGLAQLAGNLSGRLQLLPDRGLGGFPPAHTPFDLAARGGFDIGTVASQADRRLLQAIRIGEQRLRER